MCESAFRQVFLHDDAVFAHLNLRAWRKHARMCIGRQSAMVAAASGVHCGLGREEYADEKAMDAEDVGMKKRSEESAMQAMTMGVPCGARDRASCSELS